MGRNVFYFTDFSDNCLNSISIQIFFWMKHEMASNTKLFSVLCTEKIGTKKKAFSQLQRLKSRNTYLSKNKSKNKSKKNNLPTDRPTSYFNGRVTANKQFLKDSLGSLIMLSTQVNKAVTTLSFALISMIWTEV